MCFLDGLTPDYASLNDFGRDRLVEQLRDEGVEANDETLIPFINPDLPVANLTMPMPIGTIGARYALTEPLPERTVKTYILAVRNTNGIQFHDDDYCAVKDNTDWNVFVVPSDHNIMQDMPEVRSAILLSAST